MKVTKETKLKDLIPNNEEYKGCKIESEDSIDVSGGTVTIIYIESKPKEKSFLQYQSEYEDKIYDGVLPTYPSKWSIYNRLGLVWYVVEDKGGGIEEFSDIMHIVWTYKIDNYQDASTDISEEVLKLLPESFVNSFIEE